ncbi:MAG: ISAs1 family transposase [Caldilineaceae bacterium]|nr:ISAs1 family transposase [Caldilineaceae bacterium]
MTAIVPQPDVFPEATVRRLVDDLRANLAAIPDHRDRRGRVYPLASLLAIHLLAAVGDGNSPEDAADFARDPAAWLRGLGLLGERTPSAQTLRRLLRDRGPDLLAELQPLVAQLAAACEAAAAGEEEGEPAGQSEAEALRESCAVDGKSVRRSGDAARGLVRTHIVSARLDNGLTVGQAAVPDQGNELTALRQRLPALVLKDRVVSIDAMGCRTDVAETIADADGWYRLAVTDGEPNLHANLQRDFAYLDRSGAVAHDRHETVERGHGRIEHRTCTIMGGPHGILEEIDPDQRWTALGCAVRVVAERTVRGHTTRAVRYYITNLPVDTGAARIADLVRGHWAVENSLHWVLDDAPGRTAAACAPAMPPATWRVCGASP